LILKIFLRQKYYKKTMKKKLTFKLKNTFNFNKKKFNLKFYIRKKYKKLKEKRNKKLNNSKLNSKKNLNNQKEFIRTQKSKHKILQTCFNNGLNKYNRSRKNN